MSDDLHHLAAAYALDALEPDERARFEAHLASCTDCAQDVADFHATAGDLAASASTEPPPALRERVLAEVATTSQDPADGAPPTLAGRTARRTVPVLVAAVALLAVLAMGVVTRNALVERDRASDLLAVLAAPDVELVPLDGTGAGTVRVAWSPTLAASVVVGSDLPEPGDERTYELWVLAEDGPRSAGSFAPDPDGTLERRLDLPADPVDGWGITIEPAGGSPQPTGEILYLG